MERGSDTNLLPTHRRKRAANARKKVWAIAILLISFSGIYFQLTRLGYAVPLPYLIDSLCLNNCSDNASNSISHIKTPESSLLNYDKQIRQIITIDKIDKNKTSILIEKSRYRLTLYYERQPIKSYPVVLGFNPVKDKLKEGDGSTPEGIFKIRELYPHPSWSKFLWLDYPTRASWRKNIKAKLDGKIGWFDAIGKEVGIHGVPAGQDALIEKRSNWTWGCISLKTADIKELYQVVKKGTEVEIIQ